jgi:integrase
MPPVFSKPVALKRAVLDTSAAIRRIQSVSTEEGRSLFDDAVSAKTANAYRNVALRLRFIVTSAREDCDVPVPASTDTAGADGFIFSEDDYAKLLITLRDFDYAQSTIDGFRDAILHYQLRENWGLRKDEPPWAASARVKKMTKGFAYRQRRSRRGAITRPMLTDLLRWCQGNGWAHVVQAIQVQFQTATRWSEMELMRVGDLADDGASLLIRTDKRVNANNDRLPEFSKPLVGDAAADAIRLAAGSRGHNELIFPVSRCPYKHINRAIHLGADALGWNDKPDEITFTSTHSLRHGGVQHILAVNADDIEALLADIVDGETCQMSKGTRAHYNRSNRDRQSLAKAGPTQPASKKKPATKQPTATFRRRG